MTTAVDRALAERSAAWVIETWISNLDEDPFLLDFITRPDLYDAYAATAEETNLDLEDTSARREKLRAKLALARDARAGANGETADVRSYARSHGLRLRRDEAATARDRDARLAADVYALQKRLSLLDEEMPDAPITRTGRAAGYLAIAGRNVFNDVAARYLRPTKVRGVRGWRGILPGADARAGAVQAAYAAETEALATARAERAASRPQRKATPRPRRVAVKVVREPAPSRCWVCGLPHSDEKPLWRYGRGGGRMIHDECNIEIGGKARRS